MEYRSKNEFSTEEHRIAEKHLKKCSTFLIIRKMQIKIIPRFHLSPALGFVDSLYSSFCLYLFDFYFEFDYFLQSTSLECICFFLFLGFQLCCQDASVYFLQFLFEGTQSYEFSTQYCFHCIPQFWVCCVFIFIKFQKILNFFLYFFFIPTIAYQSCLVFMCNWTFFCLFLSMVI